jgi:hypothetical protein
MEELPSTGNGLSRTEAQVLDALRATNPLTLTQLFSAHQAAEDPVWRGDWSFRALVDALATAPTPLLAWLDPPPAGPGDEPAWAQARVQRTDAGDAVLHGHRDAVAMNGIDRWWGGVHLHGRDAAWRWDPRLRRIVTM